jgi:hypothetical protein
MRWGGQSWQPILPPPHFYAALKPAKSRRLAEKPAPQTYGKSLPEGKSRKLSDIAPSCLCFSVVWHIYAFMLIWIVRTTIDLPDALFRKTKAVAALRGSSMKDLIVRAVEREVTQGQGVAKPARVPLIHLGRGRKLDLTGFDLDDLLT